MDPFAKTAEAAGFIVDLGDHLNIPFEIVKIQEFYTYQ